MLLKKNLEKRTKYSPFFVEYILLGDIMLNLIEITIITIISILVSYLLGLFLIPFFKNNKKEQVLNIYLEEMHRGKKDTPTMGGIIFIIPPIIIMIILFILKRISISYNLVIVIFTYLSYSFIGFIDDYLIIRNHNNNGLSESSKLFFQILIALIIFYLFLHAGNEPLLWIHTLNIKINIGWLYGIFILLVLTSSSNSVNLTDGLDGLAGGLSIISLFTFGIIILNTGWLEGYKEITYFIFSIIGSLISFLLFNSNPAKIFMGDTGSLALGSLLGIIAILSRYEILLIIICFIFVIETLSCVIQRIYYKLTHKRIFPMTPIHHTFEKKIPEREVVRLFWLLGLLFSLIGLIVGVWL